MRCPNTIFTKTLYTYLNRSFVNELISGLDVASTGTSLSWQCMYVSLFLVCSVIFLLWNDVEWIVRSPYISRHFFPIVEARDWLSNYSLERADWFHPVRWPSLICTHRVQATSRLLRTVPMVIGCLSSGTMNTVGEMTRQSNGRGRVVFNTSYIWNNCCFFVNNATIWIGFTFILMLLLLQSVPMCG